MSLLPGSRLATVNVGTCCDKHDPVARQPELMRQIVAKSYGKSKTERYGGGGAVLDSDLHEKHKNVVVFFFKKRSVDSLSKKALKHNSKKFQLECVFKKTGAAVCLFLLFTDLLPCVPAVL